jgi:hypothetical protein
MTKVATQAIELETLDLGGWFILRTSIMGTIKLATVLYDKGFDVWTPIDRRVRRLPRSRKTRDTESPIMPTYVFARVHHLADLQMLSQSRAADVPRFALFRYWNGIPLIADRELEALKAEEARRKTIFDRLKSKGLKPPVLAAGADVCLKTGAFAGLPGRVERQEGAFTLIAFEGFTRPIKVSSLLLLDNAYDKSLSPATLKAA